MKIPILKNPRVTEFIEKGKELTPQAQEQVTVKIIGLGGVGSIVARYGSIFLNSLNCPVRLVLIDGDSFEPKNATRMLFNTCGNKAEVVALDLVSYYANSQVSIEDIQKYVTPRNAKQLINEGDIIILAVDNHKTRKFVNECCRKMDNICLISGGNDGVGKDSAGSAVRGTFGNCQIYIREGGKDITLPLTKYHPEIEAPADKSPTELHCTELIESVPQILFANLAVASCMLNLMWLYLCNSVHYNEIVFDIADGIMRPTIQFKIET